MRFFFKKLRWAIFIGWKNTRIAGGSDVLTRTIFAWKNIETFPFARLDLDLNTPEQQAEIEALYHRRGKDHQS